MTLYLEGSPEACLLQEVVQKQNQIWHLDGLKHKNAPFSQLTYSILAKEAKSIAHLLKTQATYLL